ncbi:MAG: type II secretion system protein [Patescibacteria group bacterium]
MKNSGFTLIELLVVIAIIGILTSIVGVLVSSAKNRGNDAAIKQNLIQIRNRAETLYGNYPQGNYGTISCIVQASCAIGSGGTFCGNIDLGQFATNSIFKDTIISGYINTLSAMSSSVICDANGNTWAVAARLRDDPTKSWCVDANSASRVVSGAPINAGLCS